MKAAYTRSRRENGGSACASHRPRHREPPSRSALPPSRCALRRTGRRPSWHPVSRCALRLHGVHRRATAGQRPPDDSTRSEPDDCTTRGARRAARHRERMGHLSRPVLRLPSQRVARWDPHRVEHPSVDARAHLRRVGGPESWRRHAERHPEDARRRVHERTPDGKRRRRGSGLHAQPVHDERAHARSGERAIVEWMGKRPRQHPLPARGGRAAPGTASARSSTCRST